ncbi:MAG: anhydro-N-acetylmuramic acid kinase [Gammaproteobacteria bacterium]|nr:anhydro-N-acetylmuramic acid kinase [Gammaproteobacteria bacterium]
MSDSAESTLSYIGLMSGTSMDGIDAALVAFGDHECEVKATQAVDYPKDLRDELLTASRQPAQCTVDKIGQLDRWIGECFRDATLQLLKNANVDSRSVVAIGSHGQTLRHQPRGARPFTLQIGDPNIIASGTGITTVGDFRRRDLAVGGEGAPLAPAFHRWLFADTDKSRAVLNIGGIANVTMLSNTTDRVIGFDTGPGNTLLDGWIRANLDKPFDSDGGWSRSGAVNEPLLGQMLADPYFDQPPPKSTGFEYFNGGWTRSRLASLGGLTIPAADIQATLAELSARTIATSILKFAPDIDEVLVCGGGIHNADLMQRLRGYLTGAQVSSTDLYGLHPDWVEAAAFAWLAKRRLEGKTGNLPEVTGASRAAVLGAIYWGAG